MKELIKQLNKIQRELKAPKKQENSFGNYSYRSCEDILEAVKPMLGDFILIITDDIVNIGDRYYVKATAKLTDGENEITNTAFAREAGIKKGMDESQITGSSSSYARKYALNGLFCIDDTKDADTQDNSQNKPNTTKANIKTEECYLVCSLCGAQGKISPKTGNPYCPNWKEHKANGENFSMIKPPTENEKKFDDSLPPNDMEVVEYPEPPQK